MPYFHIDAEAYSMGTVGNDIEELHQFDENIQIGRYFYEKSVITLNDKDSHFVHLLRHNKEWVFYDGMDRSRNSRLFKDIKSRYSHCKITCIDYTLVPSSGV